MKITSFNVTDVGYHYIGLRVVAAMPTATREEQTQTISRSVLKFSRDKAIRLMLPEPKSNYESLGDKICQELAHFNFADPVRNKGYTLTDEGSRVLALLENKEFVELRRTMAAVHLRTYSNLFAVVHSHIALGGLLSPIVETGRQGDVQYIEGLLTPSFDGAAKTEAAQLLQQIDRDSPKALENALRERILDKAVPGLKLPIFRAMGDRLISLRLLNIMRVTNESGEFSKSYSPCTEGADNRRWHNSMEVTIPNYGHYTIYLSEPDMADRTTRGEFLAGVMTAFDALKSQAGYYDLPDVRDLVCQNLLIPEAAFDEGINALLDMKQPPVTLGLTYDRITGRRKPLVRARENTQIFNLITRA
ncbi:hypothetical protein EP7_004377 [Isosphaeraceae bacterium EP7]